MKDACFEFVVKPLVTIIARYVILGCRRLAWLSSRDRPGAALPTVGGEPGSIIPDRPGRHALVGEIRCVGSDEPAMRSLAPRGRAVGQTAFDDRQTARPEVQTAYARPSARAPSVPTVWSPGRVGRFSAAIDFGCRAEPESRSFLAPRPSTVLWDGSRATSIHN